MRRSKFAALYATLFFTGLARASAGKWAPLSLINTGCVCDAPNRVLPPVNCTQDKSQRIIYLQRIRSHGEDSFQIDKLGPNECLKTNYFDDYPDAFLGLTLEDKPRGEPKSARLFSPRGTVMDGITNATQKVYFYREREEDKQKKRLPGYPVILLSLEDVTCGQEPNECRTEACRPGG